MAFNLVPVFHTLRLLQTRLDFSSVFTLHSETTSYLMKRIFASLQLSPLRPHSAGATVTSQDQYDVRHRTCVKPHERYITRGDHGAFDEMCQRYARCVEHKIPAVTGH